MTAMEYAIRTEREGDRGTVEEIIREAFWDLHVPGCCEHYLAHRLRSHEDFIPELDLVLEVDGELAGNIMYTRAKLVRDDGYAMGILTFGPVSIAPRWQRKGFGTRLIERSFGIARAGGWESVVIFGNPANYVGLGFKSCARYNVSLGEGVFPAGMLVRELREGAIDPGRRWTYEESEAYRIDEKEAEDFDLGFGKKEKAYRASQEEFFILSNSRVSIPR
jgi:putative acetyltransferase